MRRVALVATIVASAVAGAAPAGRVVRIERAQGKPPGTPRICGIRGGDGTAYCFGKRPEVNDVITILDSHRVLAALRAETITSMDSCAQSLQWMVQGKVDSGELPPPTDGIDMYGLLDVRVERRAAHVVKVEHPPGDLPVTTENVIAIDTNGDDRPDLEFVMLRCDGNGNPRQDGTSQCLEVWYPVGRRMEWLRTDRMQPGC